MKGVWPLCGGEGGGSVKPETTSKTMNCLHAKKGEAAEESKS